MSKSQDEIPGGISPDSASGNSDPKEDGRVAYETYQKVLREKKSRDEQLKSASEKLAAYEAEKAALEEAKLKEQGEFKALLEKEQAKRKAYEEELSGLKQGLQNSIKKSALEEKLGGKLRKSEYAAFIPFERIAIDPETMKVDDLSLAEVAEEFQKEHKVLFDFGKSGNGIPGTAPKASTKLNYDEWLKLPLKEQKARMHEVKL